MKQFANRLREVDPHNEDTFNRNPYPPGFKQLEGYEPKRVGKWEIVRRTLTSHDVGMDNLRAIRDGLNRRIVPPGTYTGLVRHDFNEEKQRPYATMVMSDTPGEAHEHHYARRAAVGRVLINGLGLGFYLRTILDKGGVEEVVVVEQSPDVLALVTPYFNDPRVTFVEADAMKWRPAKGVRFNFAWHDIWDGIEDENRPQMTALMRAYGSRVDNQACWSREYL